ncbi:beta strand repeat-containing protein [Deinococcus misasensis]|uniref:beta strand repeat-containing protein n=1 Tax=Deinococcus misasensis TaxID=392413 RepID=UPI0005535818|nr:right-handed parallel beta-helix repeat-containing protein [Deinococcus misasensis]
MSSTRGLQWRTLLVPRAVYRLCVLLLSLLFSLAHAQSANLFMSVKRTTGTDVSAVASGTSVTYNLWVQNTSGSNMTSAYLRINIPEGAQYNSGSYSSAVVTNPGSQTAPAGDGSFTGKGNTPFLTGLFNLRNGALLRFSFSVTLTDASLRGDYALQAIVVNNDNGNAFYSDNIDSSPSTTIPAAITSSGLLTGSFTQDEVAATRDPTTFPLSQTMPLACTNIYGSVFPLPTTSTFSDYYRIRTFNPLASPITSGWGSNYFNAAMPTAAVAINPTSTRIYYVPNVGSQTSGNSALYYFDGSKNVSTGKTVPVVNRMGAAPNGRIYMMSLTSLYVYDPATDALTGPFTVQDQLGNSVLFSAQVGGDLAFDQSGRMYVLAYDGTTPTNYAMYLVSNPDSTSPSAIFLGNAPAGGIQIASLAFYTDNKMYLQGSSSTGPTVEYDVATNLKTDKGNAGITANSGAADFASCVYPALNPVFTATKTVTNTTRVSGIPQAGDVLEYTVTVTNGGNVAAGNVTMSDLLPANVTYVTNSTTMNGTAYGIPSTSGGNPFNQTDGGTFPFAPSQPQVDRRLSSATEQLGVLITDTPLITGSESAVVKFRVTVNSNTTGDICNQASVTYNDTSILTMNQFGSTAPTCTGFTDQGDAPASYGMAQHTVPNTVNLRLGTVNPDVDFNSLASTGTLDDTTGTDDEDAFTGTVPLVLASTTATLSNIPVSNTTGSAASLSAWVDFDRNGTFDTDEHATVSVPNNATSVNLTWNSLPADFSQGASYIRLRLSSTALTSGQPSTAVSNGEAEDYAITLALNSITGTVLEDVNFGGTARNYSTANTSAVNSGWTTGQIRRPNARVELYSSTGAYQAFTTTDATGQYTFNVSAGSYQVRVVNSSVSSVRAGYVNTLIPVQTFRTNASTGTAVAVTNEIGGRNPAEVDAGNNAGGQSIATLDALSGQHVQSLAPVTVSSSNVTGVDFGFNFDTIVNTNNTGQGSVRQFVLNANALGEESKLAQSGNRKDISNTNQSLPSGKETSIFVIPSGQLTAGTGSLASNRTAVVNAASLIQFTGSNAQNTILDGSTQTVNVADSNPGVLGAGGTVGTGADAIAGNADDTVLNQIQRPEVEIRALVGSVPAMGLQVSVGNITIRGISIFGFGGAANSDNNANIHFDGTGNNALIEQNFIGISSLRTAFDCSAAVATAASTSTGDNLRSVGMDDGVVQFNLIGCSAGKGFGVESGSERWQIIGNEIRGNAILNSNLDGIDIENGTSGQAVVRGNLITANWGVGVDAYSGAGSNTIEYNTISGNGIGNQSNIEDPGVRIYGTGSTVRFNRIQSNVGSGVMVQASSSGNVISQNAISDNGKIGIDLLNSTDDVTRGTAPFVTVNDSGDGDTGANGLLNFPVFGTAVLTGSTLEISGFARPNSLIELFISDNDASGFGEGQIYLGSVTEGCSTVNVTTCLAADTDASTGSYAPNVNGLNQGSDNTNRFLFSIPLASLKATVVMGSKLTATATLSNNTSEFSGQVTVVGRVSGTVFEDVNFGGTARNYSTANTSAVNSGWTTGQIRRPNARVELYSSTGAYQAFTTTDASGGYFFDVSPGTYQVRVVNSSVSSVRAGHVNTLIPVQTFRTNASTGTAVAVTNEIGGRNPAEVDSGNNAGSQSIATLDALSGQHVQSLASVTLSTASITGVDFGFNFDTIVNTNDNGQGSVAQFITNANALGDESKLTQSGNRKDLSNTNQSLPSGKETSIFVIPDAQLTGAVNSRVAVINLSGASDPALPAFNGTNAQHTILDGSTQTVNVANSNQGVLGAGGTVGTGLDGVQGTADDPALSQIQRPEVQIIGRFGINGLSVTVNNITIRGIAIRGFGQNSIGSDHGDIYVAGASNLTIEQNVIGSNPTAFSDPGSGNRSSNGIVFWSGTINTVVIQNNLIGFTTNRGIAATGAVVTLDGLTVQQNEIRSTNQSGSFQGGGLELNPSYSPAGTIQRNITIQQNLITGVGTGDSAIEIGYAPSDTNKVIQDNTLSGNAFAGVAMSLDPQSGTATHNTNTGRDYIRRNVITGNGVGIQIYANGTITALENKTISQNAIYDNTGLGINLGVDAVTGNNGQKTAAQPNQMIDYPIITSSTLTSNSLQIRGVVGSNLPSNAVPSPNNSTFAGAIVEFFIADNSPANQDGEVLLGDGRTKPHGEGSIYIGQGTADANGNFNVTLTLTPAQVTALGTATNVTATATDASGNTSEFGAVLLVNTVSGRIFDDVNYGGGAGRNYTTANTSAQNGGTGFANNAIGRSGATIEVYDATVAGNPVDLDPVTAGVQNSITSGTDGVYSIQLVEGNYQIRVVNSTVSSVRTATGGTPLAVQTFRTNASTGTAVAVTSEVGGRNLAEVDAGTNATSTLATLNGVAGQEVQSFSSVNLTAGNVTGVDFGFNFDTIVNTNNAGQGSLRQFVLNSNILNNTNLNQVGQVSGKEASIFMIPETALTNDVAVINLTSSVTVTDSNTTLTGLTQTTNIADKNTGALGTGDNVGVDGLALSKVNAPEVEIILASGTTLQVNGTQFTLQGVALRGGNQLILGTSTLPATGFLIDQSIFGTTAKAFVVPTSGSLSQQFGMQIFNGSGMVQNNLIGFSATSGIDYIGGPAGVTIQNNEFQQNGRTISGGDAITLSGSLNAKAVTITGNLIANSNSSGIQFEIGSVANNVVTNNSITRNGYGGAASRLEGAGIHYLARTNAVNSTNTDLISKNLIFDNQKSGIVINYGQRNVRISQNSFYANGLTSIDFTTSDGHVGGNGNYGQGDGVTPNDGITIARQGNTGIDYPVFNVATLTGNTVNFSGFVGNGVSTTFDGQTAILEFYKADDDGNQNGPVIVGDGKNVPHGEGRTYLGSVTVTLGTNGAFSGSLTVPAGTLTSSDFLVATTTIGNNTSEFSPLVALSGFSISGSVYADLQPNSVKDGTEDWTSGTTVYVHLIQSGNVVATTPVAAGTGAFSFSSVTNGTYTLAVSRNAGTVGSPAPVIAAPLEWLYITPQNGTLQVDVLNSNVSGQNFGLFRGSLVRGRVFYDDAFGASSTADETRANNALQDLSEQGAFGVTVTAAAGSNTVTAVTDASGDFRMYLPHAQFGGQSVVLSHQVQPATGTNLNNTSSIQLATTLNDGLAASRTFTSTSGQILGTYHFGILRPAVWRPDQSGTTSSPGIIEYLHSYQPQTLGEVAFSTNGNLYYGVYGDLNCDGIISASERNINLLATPMQVGYDWPRLTDGSFKPCEVVVQVNVPSNVAPNSVDRVRVKAELSWENNTSVKNPLFLIDTTTTRSLASGGKLSLTKGLRNVTQGETNFTTNNGGKVNEVIEYKITFINSGNTVITDVVLGDNVPFFTDVVQNAYGTGELQLYCPNGSVVNVELGNISVIDLPLNLPTTCNISQMAPGEQGYFLYRVRIR